MSKQSIHFIAGALCAALAVSAVPGVSHAGVMAITSASDVSLSAPTDHVASRSSSHRKKRSANSQWQGDGMQAAPQTSTQSGPNSPPKASDAIMFDRNF